MNEMNELETLLRSWALRRPSPRVKDRIFGAETWGVAATPQAPASLSRSERIADAEVVENERLSWGGFQPVLNVARALQRHAERLPHYAVRWLAPSMAAMMLMAALVNQRNDPTSLANSSRSGPLVAMMLSNQSAAAYLPDSFQPEQNLVTPLTFEWTNGSGSTSSIRSLSVLRER